MHELPGFAEASAAWTEVRTAASLFASARGPAVGEASARLRRATIAYADAWRRALDSLRGEFVDGPVAVPALAAEVAAETYRYPPKQEMSWCERQTGLPAIRLRGWRQAAWDAFEAASHRLRTSPPGADGGPERQSAIGDLVRAARLVPPSPQADTDEYYEAAQRETEKGNQP